MLLESYLSFYGVMIYLVGNVVTVKNERKRLFKFTKAPTLQSVQNTDRVGKPPISTESTNAISCAALLMQYGPFTCMEYYVLQKRCRSYHEGETVNSLRSNINSGWIYYNAETINNPTKECELDALGLDYRGKQNTTITGTPCMVWSETSKIFTTVLIEQEGPGLLNTNYCRNPDYWYDGLWCFTIYSYWELCDVPFCQCYI